MSGTPEKCLIRRKKRGNSEIEAVFSISQGNILRTRDYQSGESPNIKEARHDRVDTTSDTARGLQRPGALEIRRSEGAL